MARGQSMQAWPETKWFPIVADMDLVFRALAYPTRRALLDELFARDGQTLVSLTAPHDMTRIAVAKHLKILEDAGLVVSRRRGRVRLVHDRWVGTYTEPWAAGLVGLKRELEDQMKEDQMAKVFGIYIRTTPERLSAERPLAEGENLIVEPPRRLVQTIRALWGPDAERAGTSRVTWEIEPVGDSCRLTLIHDQLPAEAPPEIYGGWPMVLSGLKTWLETGETLTTPGSLMYHKQQ
jgi:DNA-binding transcriptional ArsR family regulator